MHAVPKVPGNHYTYVDASSDLIMETAFVLSFPYCDFEASRVKVWEHPTLCSFKEFGVVGREEHY